MHQAVFANSITAAVNGRHRVSGGYFTYSRPYGPVTGAQEPKVE